MPRSIGVTVTDTISMGIVDGDRIAGTIHRHSADPRDFELLRGLPAEELIDLIAGQVQSLAGSEQFEAIGLAFPGVVRDGVIEDSPNLHQLKGFPIGTAIHSAFAARGIGARITISNDADVVAAGIAARHGQLDRLVRVWTLGNGIGFGRYPATEGVWEGGHMVVTLDPNEKFCGCGGRGHLEGILGARAMRLRFLDMEPDEVFQAADAGEDPRCVEFVLLWHRALAAATASSIHMIGPGKFYISGSNARFVKVALLNRYMQEMVTMSSLQGYVFEIVSHSDEFAVVGAAVNALRMAL
jgi:glucokinase